MQLNNAFHSMSVNKNRKTDSTGLVIAFYGDGKGKTSAAIGTAVRSISLGRKVAFLQFIKGDWETNEERFFRQIQDLHFEKLGKGFVNENPEKHRTACRTALKRAKEVLRSDFELVILDEILTALELKLITAQDVEKVISSKKKTCDLVLTGRIMPKTIEKKVDILTQMKKKKHIFDKGILAKNGIDF